MRYFLIPRLADVHADNGGQAILSPGWIHPKRLLTSSVLLLGLKGQVGLRIDREEFELVPGRILVLPAGLIHQGTSTLTAGAQYYWMHFTMSTQGSLVPQTEADTMLSSEGVTNHLLDNAAFLPLQFDLHEAIPATGAFRELLNEQERPSYTNTKLQLLFQTFLIQLTEAVIRSHLPPKEASTTSTVVYRILACTCERLTDSDLSIKTVASALGLNLDYVGRLFKKVMGISLGLYILKERMKLAVTKLQQTNDTLQAVALDCGFGTLRHFLRQFKAQYGMTPNEFRTHYRRMHVNSL